MVRRKVAKSSTIQERFSVQYRGPSPDSKSGLIMGNLLGSEVSLNHSCVLRCSALYPPSFCQEDFLSGTDNGRFLLVVGHFFQASNEAFGRTASVLEEKRRVFRVFPGKSGLILEIGLCDSYVDCDR